MAFDLASVLGGIEDVSNLDTNPDTGREALEYIDIDLLDSDPNNFYELTGIDELAASIELLGLQQPLRVRTNPEDAKRAIIVSGHRRAAALRKLVAEGADALRLVPCLRERSGDSPALQELKLIYANSDTRKLTSAELSKQAERVEALLYQLKEEGVEFPGRMRDHVAEACKMSRSKLARLKVIRERLDKSFVAAYESGELNESVAYRLAQESSEVQRSLFGKFSDRLNSTTEDDVGREIERGKAIDFKTLDKIISRAKEPPDFDADKYRRELDENNEVFAEKLALVAGLFISVAARGETRMACIEELKQRMRHSSYAGGEVDYSCDNKGLTLDHLNNNSISRTWTEVWDMLAIFALKHWEKQTEAEDDDRPVVKWESRAITPPIGADILTFNTTNIGDVYRPASYQGGGKFTDPGNAKKELTGIRFMKWLKIPSPKKFGEKYLYQSGDVPNLDTIPQWQTGTPTRPGRYKVVLAVEDAGTIEAPATWAQDTWQGTENFPVLAWYPLPDKYEGGEDAEEDDDEA